MVVGTLEDLPSAGLARDQVATRFFPMPVYDAGAGAGNGTAACRAHEEVR